MPDASTNFLDVAEEVHLQLYKLCTDSRCAKIVGEMISTVTEKMVTLIERGNGKGEKR